MIMRSVTPLEGRTRTERGKGRTRDRWTVNHLESTENLESIFNENYNTRVSGGI